MPASGPTKPRGGFVPGMGRGSHGRKGKRKKRGTRY